MEIIEYTPIGIFKSDYTPETGAPRQGALFPRGKGQIEVYEEYKQALNTLELFEYIIVLYHFDRVVKWESFVSPPAANHVHRFGLFSTRSPKRPNPIGFAILKLEKIEQNILWVSGLDAFNGTPVLDIKPYLPTIDRILSYRNEQAEAELGHHDEDYIKDESFYK